MNKEKRIDEMAKLICTYPQCVNYNNIGGCKIAECQTVDIAENLYNAGYRKASEIFEEIEAIKCVGLLPSSWVTQFAELKKQYTESEKDNG